MRKRLFAGALMLGCALATTMSSTTAVAAACTITGTPRSDVLAGTRRSDVICANDGNDRVKARAGDDVVHSDGGSDIIKGGKGDDTLYAGKDDDRLISVDGVAGNDAVFGRGGFDVCAIDDHDQAFGCERIVKSPAATV
jgi:Ca2+-binding RTX toxin-like protein